MTDTTERPEDIANRDYYNRTMQTRRVRIVLEADVEWRDPATQAMGHDDYGLIAAFCDAQMVGSVRLRRTHTTDVTYVDDVIRDVNGEPV